MKVVIVLPVVVGTVSVPVARHLRLKRFERGLRFRQLKATYIISLAE